MSDTGALVCHPYSSVPPSTMSETRVEGNTTSRRSLFLHTHEDLYSLGLMNCCIVLPQFMRRSIHVYPLYYMEKQVCSISAGISDDRRDIWRVFSYMARVHSLRSIVPVQWTEYILDVYYTGYMSITWPSVPALI